VSQSSGCERQNWDLDHSAGIADRGPVEPPGGLAFINSPQTQSAATAAAIKTPSEAGLTRYARQRMPPHISTPLTGLVDGHPLATRIQPAWRDAGHGNSGV